MIEKLLNSYWKSFRNFLQESVRMKIRVTILFVYFIFFVNHSQIIIEDNEEKNFTFLKAFSVWNIDELQNLYLIQGSTLIKCDSSGKQLFSQSIKSIGNVAQIEPINALKIAVFSEEQQSICLFDNTLTLNGECNYLDKYGIRNAKLIARSNRPNLFWIYDQFNSTLLLIDIISNKTIQKVDNIKGLILKGEEENEVAVDPTDYADQSDDQVVADFFGDEEDDIIEDDAELDYAERERIRKIRFMPLDMDMADGSFTLL